MNPYYSTYDYGTQSIIHIQSNYYDYYDIRIVTKLLEIAPEKRQITLGVFMGIYNQLIVLNSTQL